MRVFTCVDFTGVWPVGAAAVVVADDFARARQLLLSELDACGLPQHKEITLTELDTERAHAKVLVDGDY